MKKEHFNRPIEWAIPTAEIRIEDECLFAHYDIERDESRQYETLSDDGEQEAGELGMRQLQPSDQEPYIACYIRVPHKATLETIRQAIEENGCQDAEKSAKAIYELYTEAYECYE